MLFIFYIILSSYLYILEVNGFSLNSKNEVMSVNEKNSSFNDSHIVMESGSVMSKRKSKLHVIQHPNDAPNLKSNIFDKMLSNEMLSIKQQLYEKNETNFSPIYITFKNSIATPTLELKQRWLIDKPVSKTENKYEKVNTNKESENYTTNEQTDFATLKMDKNDDDGINKFNDSIRRKILEVRSFSARPVHHSKRIIGHQCTKRQCTCMRTNSRSTCSSRCSDYRKETCTQSEDFVVPQCTRNVVPFTYYPFYVYSTLFLGVTTDSSVIYYHPDVINELKYPKHKYSQTKKPSAENLYFESDDESQYDEKEYLEYVNSDKHKSKKAKSPKNKYEKDTTKRPEKGQKLKSEVMGELNDGYLQVLDREKFVEDIVEDLKVYYSDAVIKDCFCSLSSYKFTTENLIVYIPILMLITLIM